METLFRLLLARPAIAQAEEAPSIQLTQNSSYQTSLAASITAKDPRVVTKKASRDLVATKDYVKDLSKLPLGNEMRMFGVRLDELMIIGGATRPKLDEAILNSFGAEAEGVVSKKEFKAASTILRDSITSVHLNVVDFQLFTIFLFFA